MLKTCVDPTNGLWIESKFRDHILLEYGVDEMMDNLRITESYMNKNRAFSGRPKKTYYTLHDPYGHPPTELSEEDVSESLPTPVAASDDVNAVNLVYHSLHQAKSYVHVQIPDMVKLWVRAIRTKF